MRLRSHARLILVLAVVAVLRMRGIADPFTHPLDGVFQESLALGHLKYGLAVTKGLAVTTVLDGKPFFHASHPPLLQLIYAGLYSIVGKHEWASRSVSILAALVVTATLWFASRRSRDSSVKYVTVAAFALMPMSVALGGATNYEPLALAAIALIYLIVTETVGSRRVLLLTIVAILGGLIEWTVYLAWPAAVCAIYFKERSIKSLKALIVPSMVAAVTLALLLAWQKHVVGHAPMLSHAATRSDPTSINAALAFDYLARLKGGAGFALMLALVGAVHAARGKIDDRDAVMPVVYFALVPISFLLTAPQLVLAHPISQYYLAPIIAILVGFSCEALSGWLRKAALTVVFVSFIIMNRPAVADFQYNLADLAAARHTGSGPVFDSSAVGYLRYYHDIETIHPLGGNEPPPSEIVKDGRVALFILDTRNSEVEYARDAVEHAPGLSLLWKFDANEVWARDVDPTATMLANMLDKATLPPATANFWETPMTDIARVAGAARFGIFHHARDGASTIRFDDVKSGMVFEAVAAFDIDDGRGKSSDGVEYSVVVGGGEWRREAGGIVGPRRGQTMSAPITMDLTGAPERVSVELTVRPLGDASFDRFYWIDPTIKGVTN